MRIAVEKKIAEKFNEPEWWKLKAPKAKLPHPEIPKKRKYIQKGKKTTKKFRFYNPRYKAEYLTWKKYYEDLKVWRN